MMVVLTTTQMNFCRYYAGQRWQQALRRGVAGYGRIGNEIREIGIDAHFHGLLAEGTLVVVFGKDNIIWNYYVDGDRISLPTLPELVIGGVCVDAKAISEYHLSLLCKAGTVKPDWAYVLVAIKYAPLCRILGWMWGREVLAVPVCEPQPGRPAHLIRQGDIRLRNFQEFIDHVGLPVVMQ